MLRTLEAVIDEQRNVRLLEPVDLPASRRALVTVLEEASDIHVSETALLSESVLAEDWNQPEEEATWSHLHAQLKPGISSHNKVSLEKCREKSGN